MRVGGGTRSTGSLTAPAASPRIRSAMPVDSESVPLGSAAADFTLTTIDGSEVTLSALKGRPVVLVFLRGFT